MELLAPARTADIGVAAIDCGADAVYIAGPAFGARQAAGNPVEDIRRLCRIQYRILENAASYLKPGGTLVYSTCTVSPLENRNLTDHFLKKNGEEFEEVFRKQYSPDPDGTDGFYICKMRRKA